MRADAQIIKCRLIDLLPRRAPEDMEGTLSRKADKAKVFLRTMIHLVVGRSSSSQTFLFTHNDDGDDDHHVIVVGLSDVGDATIARPQRAA